MIGVTGYMSGGKSYFAVEHMMGMMMRGHRVVSNIRLCCQGVTSYTGLPCIFWKQLYYFLADKPAGYHEIAINDYENYPTGSPRGSATYDKDMCYIYLDEASSIFDSMTHAADKGIQKVATWCRHTEKRGQRMFLIMQFASELHKRLRVHITEYIACCNTSTLKIPLLGVGVPWFLQGMTIRTRYLSDGETQICPAKWFRIEPRVYKCYQTAQIVVGENDIKPYRPVVLNYSVLRDRQLFLAFVRLSLVYVLLTCLALVLWVYVYV